MDVAKSPCLTRKSLLDLWTALGGVSSHEPDCNLLHASLHHRLPSSAQSTHGHTAHLPGQPVSSTLPISGSTDSSPVLTLPLTAVPGASSSTDSC